MTDVEIRLRDGLAVLAEAIEPSIRPAPAPAPRRRRRWAILAPAIVGGLTVTGVAAAATGVLPHPVRDRFREMAGWGAVDHLDPDSAHLVATDDVDGRRYELWTAEGPGGGRCDYIRQIVVGRPENGARLCNVSDVLVFGREDFWFSSEGESGPDDADTGVANQYGRAPVGTAEVAIGYVDGTERRIPVGEGGWFLDASRGALRPWRSYVAYDADGRVVARYDQP